MLTDMSPKMELLLYQLLWVGEQVAQPTFKNLSAGFEGWAYNAGLLRAVQRLERLELLETEGRSLARVVRLTEKGHRLVSGTRDSQERWSRQWDGTWRMVLFDVPEDERALRSRLRKVLSRCHFGCLQQSVWISPDPMSAMTDLVRKRAAGQGSLTLVESRVLPGQSDSDLVSSAWKFKDINGRYQEYLDFLDRLQDTSKRVTADALVGEEKLLWDQALAQDPLLPEQLLPTDYLGKTALKRRQKLLPKMIGEFLKRDRLSIRPDQ